MRNFTLSLLATILVSVMSLNAQTMLIDFGFKQVTVGGSLTDARMPSPWNNITHYNQSGGRVSDGNDSIITLIDNTSASTGIVLTITDPFDANNAGGVDPINSATTGDAAAAGFTGMAAFDNLYVYYSATNNPPHGIAKMELSNLDPAKTYDFTFYSARIGVTEKRAGQLTATGLNTASDTLNASNNLSRVKTLSAIVPNAQHKIELKFEFAPSSTSSYAYLSALKITGNSTTKVDNVMSSPLAAYVKNSNLIVSDYTGLVKVYSITGKLVANGQAVFGYMPLQLQKGIYLVETTQGKCKLYIH